jgi:hypothetical protein
MMAIRASGVKDMVKAQDMAARGVYHLGKRGYLVG